MFKKFIFISKIIFFSLIFVNNTLADLQQDLINKLISTNTLSFDFKQKIEDEEEIGNCFIKYPLLMKCNYKDPAQKILISNGKTVAIIKKNIKKFIITH